MIENFTAESRVLYLILHLINKAAQMVTSRRWSATEELVRIESSFQFFIFAGINILLILSLLKSLPSGVWSFMGISLGVFIFLTFFSANYTFEQHKKTLLILFGSIFLYEVFVILLIAIPFIAKITENALVAFCYTWIIQICLYLAIGGILAYALITVGYSMISGQGVPFLAILQQEREQGNYRLELLLGLDILIGIILTMFIPWLEQLYVGF